MVVDHMAMLAAPLRRSATPQGQQLRRAEKAFEPVVIKADIEAVADQARGNAIGTRRRMKPPLDVTSTRTSS